MRDKPTKIKPGIVVRDFHTGEERTLYPTGPEWVLAFALRGCQWAIDFLESGELDRRQTSLWVGENI